jgi:hypothetical protein
MSKKQLTERQKVFLDALLGDAKGSVRAAMKIAGYSDSTSVREAMAPVAEEVAEAAQMLLALNAPKAALGMVGVLDDPSALGARNTVAAAKELLDRAGVVKKEKVEVSGPEGAMFILPPKQTVDD